MFSASLGQGSRLPRWLRGVRPVSRPLWASVPELPRGLGSRWPLGVVRGCARCPRGCPGPATRPLHASSFSSLPWTSSSARDTAGEKRVSRAVAPLGGRLPGARAAHRDPSLHRPLGRGALPGAGPAPQRAPAPPAPPWAPLEKASVSGETDCAGWKLLSPRRTADFHVTDAVRSEGRGHGARGREAGCTPQGLCGESAEEGRERAQGVWARPRLPRPRGAGGAWVGSRMPLARSCRAQGSPPSWTADGLAPLSLWPACNLPGGPLSRDRQERPLGRLGVFRSSAWPSGVLEDSAARLLAAGGSVCTCSAHTYRVPTVRQVWN